MFSTHLNVLVIYLKSTLLPHNGMKQTLFIVGCMQLCATPFVTRSHVRTNDFPILQAFVDSQKYIFLFSYIYIFLVDFFCEFFNFLCKGTSYNYRYISSIYMYWTYIHVQSKQKYFLWDQPWKHVMGNVHWKLVLIQHISISTTTIYLLFTYWMR